MFQVKDFISITASMINWMRASTNRVTDYNVGSAARTMMEAPAAEIDELYQQMFIGIKEAIPVSTYNTFDFDQLPAFSAAGLVRVQLTPGTAGLIAAGTTVSGVGLTSSYTVLADVVVPDVASYVDISVAADVPGTVGNIAQGQALTLTPSPTGFVSATNLAAFSSGAEKETDDERKLRFAAYITSLARSTVAAIHYGLGTAYLTDAEGNIIEHVESSEVIEPYLADPNAPVAQVDCYIHNGTGSTSSALIAQAQRIIDGYYDDTGTAVPGYKAAGIPVNVYAAAEVAVNVTGNLSALVGYDEPTLVALAVNSVAAYLLGLAVGAEVQIAEIIRIVKSLEGVDDFALTLPVANVAISGSQKAMPGSLNIT